MWEKTNEPILRKQTDGRTDWRVDRPYFTGPFRPRSRVRFEQLLLYNPLSGCFCFMAIMCGQTGARYAKSHTKCVTHALFKQHTHKNTRKDSHVFPYFCKYVFEKSCSKVFSKNICFLCFEMIITSMNLFPFKNVIWYFTAPWCCLSSL